MRDEVIKRIHELTALQVREWLQERLKNCERIGKQKMGDDYDGWVEDAAHYAAAIGLIDWTVDNRN